MQKITSEVLTLRKGLQEILYFSEDSKNIDFYISSLTEYNPQHTTHDILEWLKTLNSKDHFDVEQIPLSELNKWKFNDKTGDLQHESGGFFSIRGLHVKTNMGSVPEWTQPIIHQPEKGILGILTKKINGILYFLLQAKAEPGNINTYELSPTVQATRSNYMRLHGGKPTPYLEYFLGQKNVTILVDQLQSEQGARFYKKRNRNIIVKIDDDEEVELLPQFKWLTLAQIQELAQHDNVMNMDTRSIISEINFAPEKVTSLNPVNKNELTKVLENSEIIQKPVSEFGINLAISCHPNSKPLHTTEVLVQKITQEKFKSIVEATLIPLNQVENWNISDEKISHDDKKYFSVIGVRIKATDREVSAWDQPIIKQEHKGIVGFIAKEINGVIHFLIQLKMECGVLDLLELAPTVQCITDNYTEDDMPLFTDKFLNRKGYKTIFDVFQSEEGGRFFHESNQNITIIDQQQSDIEEPPFYLWMTLNQLKEFIKFSNFVNIEARSLLCCLKMN